MPWPVNPIMRRNRITMRMGLATRTTITVRRQPKWDDGGVGGSSGWGKARPTRECVDSRDRKRLTCSTICII